MSKVRLKFMVDPEQLRSLCVVPDPVRVVIVDPEAIFLTGILGESGRRMVRRGLAFYFTRRLAEKLTCLSVCLRRPPMGRLGGSLINGGKISEGQVLSGGWRSSYGISNRNGSCNYLVEAGHAD